MSARRLEAARSTARRALRLLARELDGAPPTGDAGQQAWGEAMACLLAAAEAVECAGSRQQIHEGEALVAAGLRALRQGSPAASRAAKAAVERARGRSGPGRGHPDTWWPESLGPGQPGGEPGIWSMMLFDDEFPS